MMSFDMEENLTIIMLVISIGAVVFNFLYNSKFSTYKIEANDKNILGMLDKVDRVLENHDVLLRNHDVLLRTLEVKVSYIESYFKDNKNSRIS